MRRAAETARDGNGRLLGSVYRRMGMKKTVASRTTTGTRHSRQSWPGEINYGVRPATFG